MNNGDAAKSAIGVYLMAMVDGSVSDLSDEEAFAVTGLAATDPASAAKAVGVKDADAASVTPQAVQSLLLDEFYDAGALRDFEDLREERAANVGFMRRRRDDAERLASGMTPDDAARMEFDAANGDTSAYVRMKEKFYLG